MSTTFSFADRFSYPSPDGPSPTVSAKAAQTLTEAQLFSLSEDLTEMVAMVRNYSVIVQKASATQIFNTITTESDPRIGLILAAAKSKIDNQPLFGQTSGIKEIMFNDPARPNATLYTNRDLFSDGIRRVSAALTASRLIGQLAQIPQQADHSKWIEEQALADLDRIVQTWELRNKQLDNADNDSETSSASFYFEPLDFTVPTEKEVVVEWQSPAISPDWSLVGNYTGDVSTWQIVSDLSDAINSQNIIDPDNTILAAAELAGPYIVNPAYPNSIQYHVLSFYPRRPVPGVYAYSINIRINVVLLPTQTDNSPDFPLNRSPFIWGNLGVALNTYIVNGQIIVIRYNKLLSDRAEAENYQPFVLYARNKYIYTATDTTTPPPAGEIVIRAQPWQPNLSGTDENSNPFSTIEIPFPRLISPDPAIQLELDNNRFSQFMLALSNSLAEFNIDAGVTSALIRNDAVTANNPSAALELVAWARRISIAGVVLDILKLPEDIEVATGDRGRAVTSYSSKPRSIVVPNPYTSSANGLIDASMRKEQSFILKRKKSPIWQICKDEAEAVVRRGYSI